jgi:hypothetical protein
MKGMNEVMTETIGKGTDHPAVRRPDPITESALHASPLQEHSREGGEGVIIDKVRDDRLSSLIGRSVGCIFRPLRCSHAVTE